MAFGQGWSADRIKEEIASRRSQITELKEALSFHEEAYAQNPQDGFQGNDLYSAINRLESEIADLRERL